MGIRSCRQIAVLRKMSRLAIFSMKYGPYYFIVPVCSAFNFLMLFAAGFHFWPMLSYGTPASIGIILFGWTLFSLIAAPILCFMILCHYLRLKLDNISHNIALMKEGIRFHKFESILLQLDFVYREIHEYDTTYWSKVLCCFWVVIGIDITIFLSELILFDLPIFVIIALLYAMSFLYVLFLAIVLSAASVNYRAVRIYESLNSLFVSQIQFKSKLATTLRSRPKFEVYFQLYEKQ